MTLKETSFPLMQSSYCRLKSTLIWQDMAFLCWTLMFHILIHILLFWKTNLVNKRWKCGSGASCDGERPPIEEFVPPGLTVNHAFYKDVLERLRKRVQRVRMDIADDNLPAHTALAIREFLTKKKIPVLPQPLYSPDLAPCDFYLFPKLKLKLKGHRFGTIEQIQKTVTDNLHTLTENDFQYCCEQWKKRWNHYVSSQGSYFEGDHL